uniref:Variant surface glycoprotein 1125.5216 n=1 Tax=Trypanosoma brucei TaxID=5691 RepID=A0A1J0RC36_9TRYP|nr:variant surface glycoprotein 1125.5216 [Trypanosoma brucei]
MIRPIQAVYVAAIVIAAAVCQRSAEATTEPGSNGGAFSLLCTIVNMLNAGTQPPDTIQAMEHLAAEICALNLSQAPANFRDSIKEDKTWQTLADTEKPSADDDKATWEKYYNYWAASKKQIAKKKEQYETWGKKNLAGDYLSELKKYAEIAYNTYTNAELTKYATLETTRKTQADLALYGAAGPAKENAEDAAGTRENTCGLGGGGSSNKAGSTIRRDMACLCAKGTGTAVNNVCSPDCDYSDEPEWTSAAHAKTKFDHLITKCTAYAPTLQLTSSNLNNILEKLHVTIGGLQGTAAKKHYVLRHLDGTWNNGCDGKSEGNGGVCVIYKETAGGTTKHADIAWKQPAKLA